MAIPDIKHIHDLGIEIGAKLDACDHSEGTECATLDASLKNYATACCRFCESAREWGRDVFAGKLPYDVDVERAWLDEAHRLYVRAISMQNRGRTEEVPCWILEGQAHLQAALWQFYMLLLNWVSPKLSVGPSPRIQITATEEALEEIKKRVADLPAFPHGWRPEDQAQRAVFLKKISSSTPAGGGSEP